MASSSLSSASTYLNNLLLARGLLQNGKAIDFANPDRDNATMSRVINVIHDLVLRRDRDAEQRESLANSLRSMRAEEAQRVLDMQRVHDKNAELMRNISMIEAQERSLKASVRKAEASAKDLKEQTLKMKSTLDQTRAKCLSDVRKRDLEIENLKRHLTGSQRGKRDAHGGMKINTTNMQTSVAAGREARGGPDMNSAEWALEKESNDLLAALINETSTENVTLRGIVTETLETLQQITGFEEDLHEAQIEDKEIGIPGQYRKSRHRAAGEAQEAALVSCETLARNMSIVLEHCKSILKDPSFVPIEEVHIREEEILKLRDGWEKMAARWKEAVTMMDTWRRRMLEGGAVTVEMGQLSDLGFGRSVAVLPNGQPVLGQDEEDLSSLLFDTSKIDLPHVDEQDEEDEKAFEQEEPHPFDEDEEESSFDIPAPSPKRLAMSPPKRGLKLPRPPAALAEANANIKTKSPSKYPSNDLTKFSRSPDSGIGSLNSSSHDDENDTFAGRNLGRSKMPRLTKPTLPPLSVPEKLAAIEAEAIEMEEEREREQQEQVTHKRKPTAKVKANGLRRSRRRSTLSPAELAALMGVR